MVTNKIMPSKKMRE